MSVLTEVSCPNCLAPIDFHGHSNNNMISCGACNTNFIVEGHLCPKCSSYYKSEVDNCGQCGTAMTRTCGKCHANNWAGDEYCKSCGVSMDLIDASIQQFHEQSAEHKAARLAQVTQMRIEEEALSQKRMAEIQQVELERQAKIRARKIEQKRRDVYAMMFVGAVGVCVLILGIWIIINSS